MSDANRDRGEELLTPLLERPERSAVLLDIDGTLAPIVARAEDSEVPEPTSRLLERLASRYGLVACVSGRRAEDARRLVGVDSLTYVGNHGLERLSPGAEEVEISLELARLDEELRAFAESAYTPRLESLGVRLEDKRSIWSFHWRSAEDERAARAALEDVAGAAERRGLAPHWGRKVLEVRPPLGVDKGTAVSELVRDAGSSAALYAGDDNTDLHAFRALRRLQEAGRLEGAVCVGVRSDEAPAELARESDLLVDGPAGVTELLERLARCPSPTS